MVYKVDANNVQTIGLEDSAVAYQLAGLRSHIARYFRNNYHQEFLTLSTDEAPEILNRLNEILKKQNLDFPYQALEVSDFATDNIRWSYVFYTNGLVVGVKKSLTDGQINLGFKLVEGVDTPKELAKYDFIRQRSSLAGIIREASEKIIRK